MESHNDNPYWREPMVRLVLYVHRPAMAGGQALITDGRRVLEQLQREAPDIVEELSRRQIRYVTFFADAERPSKHVITSWQSTYANGCNGTAGCDLKAAAEAQMRENGQGFEWTDAGLRQWTITDAIKPHPITGELTWMNQLTAMHCSVFHNHPQYPEFNEPRPLEPCRMVDHMPYHTMFGDGEEFPQRVVDTVRRVQWENSVAFDYQAGDGLIIDNFLAMHGRFSFEGNRQLYLSLTGLELEARSQHETARKDHGGEL